MSLLRLSAACALLVLSLAPQAEAQSPRSAKWPEQSGPAPQRQPGDLGVAIMSAVMSKSGELLGGAGVTTAFRYTGYIGQYEVQFGRSVTGCALALTSMTDKLIEGDYGHGVAQYLTSNPNAIYVLFYDQKHSQFTDTGFSLIVYCDR